MTTNQTRHTPAEAVQYWYDAATERREERDRLRAVVARIRQMADAWEQQLPEVIRTPAVVSALRAALEPAVSSVGQAPADRKAEARIRALHQPMQRGPFTICAHCSGWDGEWRCLGVVTNYPCPTLRALDAECTECGDTGACNGGPCPLTAESAAVVSGRAADETGADVLRLSEEICPGFPDRCPNLRTVEPEPGVHLGGIRCGCADGPAVGGAPQPKETDRG
jgi:hypothetical protein